MSSGHGERPSSVTGPIVELTHTRSRYVPGSISTVHRCVCLGGISCSPAAMVTACAAVLEPTRTTLVPTASSVFRNCGLLFWTNPVPSRRVTAKPLVAVDAAFALRRRNARVALYTGSGVKS